MIVLDASVPSRRFERRVVGAKEHEELWVPADELPLFNANIEGRIDVSDAFFGDGYEGTGQNARERFVAIAAAADPRAAVTDDRAGVFLDFFFWEQMDFRSDGIDLAARDAVLASLRHAWEDGASSRLSLGRIGAVTI